MQTLPPYKITVYNRVAQRQIGTFRSNQVPRVDELVGLFGDYRVDGDPFEGWNTWKVDQVVWPVAEAGSQTAVARTGGYDQAVCTTVELHCWPAEGPWLSDTPQWAKAAVEPGYHNEEPS